MKSNMGKVKAAASFVLRPAGVSEAREMWTEQRQRAGFVKRIFAEFKVTHGTVAPNPPMESYGTAAMMFAFALIEAFGGNPFAAAIFVIVGALFLKPVIAWNLAKFMSKFIAK